MHPTAGLAGLSNTAQIRTQKNQAQQLLMTTINRIYSGATGCKGWFSNIAQLHGHLRLFLLRQPRCRTMSRSESEQDRRKSSISAEPVGARAWQVSRRSLHIF